VDNVCKKGDIRDKSGDDYPIRVYVMFPYDPKQADITERLSEKNCRRQPLSSS
jgi:hypothetical protein